MLDIEEVTRTSGPDLVDLTRNLKEGIVECCALIDKNLKDFDTLELEDGSIIDVKVIEDEPTAEPDDDQEYWNRAWVECFSMLNGIKDYLEMLQTKYWEQLSSKHLGDGWDHYTAIESFLAKYQVDEEEAK